MEYILNECKIYFSTNKTAEDGNRLLSYKHHETCPISGSRSSDPTTHNLEDSMLGMKRMFVIAGFCLFTVLSSLSLVSAAWPERPIQFIVPYGAGGGADVAARIICASLGKELGVAVAVVNVPGVSATLGMNQVVEASPDGYTIACFHEGHQATNVIGIGKYSLNDLTMICTLYNYPNIVVTRSGAWKDLKEFVADAKKKPGELKAAVVLGGASYFFVLDLMDVTGIDLKLVPYNGHAERVNAVLGTFADMTESAPTTVASMMRAKKLVPLAMFTKDRDPVYPDIPTAIEQGYDITFVSNYVLTVPKGTPDEIVKRLNEASKKVMADPEVISKLAAAGSPAFYQPASEIKPHMDKTSARYRELAKKFNLDTVKKQ
ncbi:hypothetical protein FACS1894206_02010 [Deltaproteobacteria bacterium]|nr:hypothetical protein FACS1894206_02010 [Deltaproteobacteria bacterium]